MWKYAIRLLLITLSLWKIEAILPSGSTNRSLVRTKTANESLVFLRSLPPNVEENSSCPFSMKYPRYRVQVSSGKEKPNYSAKSGGLFAELKLSMKKAAVEKKYSSDVKENNFFWVESEIDLSNDSERIAKGKVGVFTSYVVWRKLASMIDSFNTSCIDRAVISIPNASMMGLTQIKDIINWFQEEQDRHVIEAGNVKVGAYVDYEVDVPTIILTASRGEGCLYPKNDQAAEDVIDGTKSWVSRVLVKLGICPFTKAVNKSGQGLGDVGIPVGNIAYHYSDAARNDIPHLMAGKSIS